jgi:hypothetical protein
MAIKTFTTGEVLTAADTNTYLANSGLVYITSGALSGTATNYAGCFTSTYDNYRIVISSYQANATAYLYWRLLSGTTPATSADYSFACIGLRVDGVAINNSNGANASGYTGISQSGVNNTPLGNGTFDIYSPKLSQRTFMSGNSIGYLTNWYGQSVMSHYNLSNSYDGIQFLTDGAPTFGGTVTIYGYRKP